MVALTRVIEFPLSSRTTISTRKAPFVLLVSLTR